MDKVKQILEMLRKHHFWILCGVAGIVGLAAWYLSSGKLQAEFTKNAETVGSTLKKVDAIASTPQESWKEQTDKKLAEVKKSVKAARDLIYDAQKKTIFIWPAELGDDFVQAAEKLEGTTDRLSVELCERYLDWVKNSVRTLATTVDAAMPNEAALNLAASSHDSAANATEHKVSWTQLGTIQQTFDWDQRPSTLLVKYAQEELWVYKALCNIIAKLNATAQGPHEATVTEITSMDIAYLASEDASKTKTKGRIQPMTGAGAAAGAGTEDRTTSAPPVDPNSIVKPDVLTRGKKDAAVAAAADAAMPALSGDELWKTYRYVDDKGEPITTVAADAPRAEYNLMPFRLLLRMDRRGIDRLLLECRNSPLPIEVQQVRINPSATTTSSGGGGRGGGGGHGHDGEVGGGGGGGGNAAQGKPFDRSATVEVRGIIYLLQPEPKTPPPTEAAAPDGADPAAPENGEAAETPAVATPPANNE